MKNQSPTLLKALPPAWRPAFERLDTALRENTGSSNARKIAALRKVCFADVEALEASGEVVIPVLGTLMRVFKKLGLGDRARPRAQFDAPLR